jgi:hypothetical protein
LFLSEEGVMLCVSKLSYLIDRLASMACSIGKYEHKHYPKHIHVHCHEIKMREKHENFKNKRVQELSQGGNKEYCLR